MSKATPRKKPKATAPPVSNVTMIETADGQTVPAEELAHLHPLIRQYAVRVDSLERDPDNARLHTERNLRAVANSLRNYGQQPLLLSFDPTSRVIKVGNGRHEVATDPKWGLNWKWIAAIPSNLAAADLKAFAIADNRTAELAEWDSDVVERQLKELESEIEDFDATELGFDVQELNGLLKGDFEQAHGFTPVTPKREPPAKKDETYTPQFLLIIKCTSEKQQAELINEFEGRGIECTAPSA